MRCTIIYESTHGQTEKIARYLQSALEKKGVQATCIRSRAPEAAILVTQADVLILGTPIHASSPSGRLIDFVKKHQNTISKIPCALFVVSLASRPSGSDIGERTAGYLEIVKSRAGIQPIQEAGFQGALRYRSYNPIVRFMMQKISKQMLGDTDTSRDYEYTDWQTVEAFAVNLVESMNPQHTTGNDVCVR